MGKKKSEEARLRAYEQSKKEEELQKRKEDAKWKSEISQKTISQIPLMKLPDESRESAANATKTQSNESLEEKKHFMNDDIRIESKNKLPSITNPISIHKLPVASENKISPLGEKGRKESVSYGDTSALTIKTEIDSVDSSLKSGIKYLGRQPQQFLEDDTKIAEKLRNARELEDQHQRDIEKNAR